MKSARYQNFIILILIFFLTNAFSETIQEHSIISIEKTYENQKILKHLPLDFLMEKEGQIYIVSSAKDRSLLRTKGLIFKDESENFPPFNPGEVFSQTKINGVFHSYSEVEQELKELENQYPEIVKIYDIGDSLEGRNIYAVKISTNVQFDEKKPGIMISGCHHAREWISVEVPLYFAHYLAQNYDSDNRIKKLITDSSIWIIPVVNPDGLEYSIHYYRYWRKNRRDNKDESFGVDLNRNYSFQWGHDNYGSEPDTDSSVYRGTAPFSEPETQAVRSLFTLHDFQAMASYHSYAQSILFPWGYKGTPAPNNQLLLELAQTMSDLIYAVNGRHYEAIQGGAEFYLTNGDFSDWVYGTYQIPAFGIELPPLFQIQGGFIVAESDIQAIFEENLPALLYLIEWSIENWNGINTDDPQLEKKESRNFQLNKIKK